MSNFMFDNNNYLYKDGEKFGYRSTRKYYGFYNKLTRLKQTLTIGFQQAQDSGMIRYGNIIFF
jgi:hypothetical protein